MTVKLIIVIFATKLIAAMYVRMATIIMITELVIVVPQVALIVTKTIVTPVKMGITLTTTPSVLPVALQDIVRITKVKFVCMKALLT